MLYGPLVRGWQLPMQVHPDNLRQIANAVKTSLTHLLKKLPAYLACLFYSEAAHGHIHDLSAALGWYICSFAPQSGPHETQYQN